MDPSLILPYLWVLLVLVFLEGLLAADNAIVMAVMVKHLPPKQRKSTFYGLLGAFIFRFIALFLISIIANFWWIQAAGAVYLIYMSIKIYGNFSISQMKNIIKKQETNITSMKQVTKKKWALNLFGEQYLKLNSPISRLQLIRCLPH